MILKSRFTFSTNQWLLLGIILLGAILRFYNYFDIPYTHDEISALLRTDFENFNDLIEEGVKKNDFHPAGIQVFLYYWVQLVGSSEWIVKLPFTLASIASIYLAYQIGKKWRNETVGLLFAVFSATSQYAIIYGTIARPYASGLFFVLLLVNAFINMCQSQNFWRNWMLFVLAGTLCAYNHHYSLLVAGLIGILGVFIVPKKLTVKYIFSAVPIFILYLPHLPILSYQMGIGGVGGEEGWLGPPSSHFFWDYIQYLFHYSSWTLLFTGILIVYGFFNTAIHSKTASETSISYIKFLLISIIVFFVPLALGYYYSIYINPIIQFSILIFSHLFLYGILFGHFKNLSPLKNGIILSIIAIVNVSTLIYTRQHYKLHYTSIHEKVADDLVAYRKSTPKLPAVIFGDWGMRKFHSQQNGFEPSYHKFEEFESNNQFIAFLDSIKNEYEYFYFGGISQMHPLLIPLIQNYFPHIKEQKNYNGGSTYLFSKKGGKSLVKHISNYSSNQWKLMNPEILKKNENNYYIIDSLQEFGPSITFDLSQTISRPSNFVDIHIPLNPIDSTHEFLIVSQFELPDTIFQWESSSSKHQLLRGQCKELVHTVRLYDLHEYEAVKLKIILWNITKKRVEFKDIQITERQGNPFLYWSNDPIK